jgi:hypothetical protein
MPSVQWQALSVSVRCHAFALVRCVLPLWHTVGVSFFLLIVKVAIHGCVALISGIVGTCNGRDLLVL